MIIYKLGHPNQLTPAFGINQFPLLNSLAIAIAYFKGANLGAKGKERKGPYSRSGAPEQALMAKIERKEM